MASEAVARQLRVTRGAMVQAVAPNSAAAAAGLLPTRRALSGIIAGDVITAIDQRPVTKAGAPCLLYHVGMALWRLPPMIQLRCSFSAHDPLVPWGSVQIYMCTSALLLSGDCKPTIYDSSIHLN